MRKKSYNSAKGCAEGLIEIQAVANDNSKRRGEAVEAAFLAKTSSLRLVVCTPWGDSERYDSIVDHGTGFWRVQVKGKSTQWGSNYTVVIENNRGRAYTRDEIDFFVIYIVPENVWYVVPIEVAEGRQSLSFSPSSRRNPQYEKYREAWCLLDCSRNVRGWKDIPVLCRSRELSVRCWVCPLREAQI